MQIETKSFVVALTAGLLLPTAVFAGDWGYDDESTKPKEVESMRATAQTMGSGKAAAKKNAPPRVVTGKPAATGAASKPANNAGSTLSRAAAPLSPGAAAAKKAAAARALNSLNSAKKDDNTLARECWAQIFQVASGKELTADQRSQLNAVLNRRLTGTEQERDATRKVIKFWPKLTTYLIAHPDEKPGYASLLKALLRWRARGQGEAAANGRPGDIAVEENAVTADILGPIRMAVPGTVPFSEEAIDAYADMACFIYEQQNPGKTIDALDNRAVFATVVSGKFRDAPSDRAREGMAAFDLSWSKFKIAWLKSDAKQREALVEALMKTGAGSAAKQVQDPILDLVITNWPPILPKQPLVSTAPASPDK